MPAAIGIDVGTTNLKVVLVDADARVIGAAQRPLESERGPGTAEQDATATWDRLVDAVRTVTSAHPAVAADVVAMAVCSQYSSIVPVDAHGVPVAPMLMWQDQRGTDHSFAIMSRDHGAFATFVERHGMPPIGSGLSLGHILHLQLDRPDIHEKTHAYLEAMDYVTARLTGRLVASQHTSYMVQCCDNRTLGSIAYDPDLVRLAGVDETRLPPLVRVDEAVGDLLPEVAGKLGLPAPVVVYVPANDTAAVAVATGAFSPGRAGLAIGTTSVLVDAVADFRTDLEHQIFSMPGPYADRYVVCAENGLSGKVLEHVLERVVYAADALGDHRVGDAYAQLDAVLGSTESGAGGVMFLPWLGGSLAPVASGAIRGASCTCRSTPAAPTSCARSWRAWHTTSAGCCPTSSRSRARQFARSCSWAARPARRSGARCSPTCSIDAFRRSGGPKAAPPGRWPSWRSSGTECCRPPTSTGPPREPTPRSNPIPRATSGTHTVRSSSRPRTPRSSPSTRHSHEPPGSQEPA